MSNHTAEHLSITGSGEPPHRGTVAHARGLAGLLAPLLASVVLGLAGTPAAASPALAERSRCLACHQVDRKVVGPAFRDIGRRYGSAGSAGGTGAGSASASPNPELVAHLARKIRQGGSGAWGVVPMSANPHVSEEDARRLAEWILTLR
ncbi:MAG: c-type cytochrome [Rubrivivax sp.]